LTFHEFAILRRSGKKVKRGSLYPGRRKAPSPLTIQCQIALLAGTLVLIGNLSPVSATSNVQCVTSIFVLKIGIEVFFISYSLPRDVAKR